MNNPILQPINRFLSNPSLVALVIFFGSIGAIFYFMGSWLVPLIISIAIAYLLEGVVYQLERSGVRRILAVSVVFSAFCAGIFYILTEVVPTIIEQTKNLFIAIPTLIGQLQEKLLLLPKRFSSFFTVADVNGFISSLTAEITNFSKTLFSTKLFSSLVFLITILVYFVLVPLLVFFLLKDKKEILRWLGKFMPEKSQIIHEIWKEVDVQIGNYIRGKFSEILIVWVLCLIPFYYFDLNYWLLLSFLVGLSVLIPYIGATLVTIPVLVVAYMQFGASSSFYWIITAYSIIQIIDGNVFVPLIFSEAVNIHPVAIITAVLVFGGLWGFWGIFFAIPLATLVKATMEAWQRYGIAQENGD